MSVELWTRTGKRWYRILISDQLEAMLQRAASTQEQQVEQMINILLTLFEPLMILVMGGIVLFIVLAILLPIFNMDQFVH